MIKTSIVLLLFFSKLCIAESNSYAVNINDTKLTPQAPIKIIERQSLFSANCDVLTVIDEENKEKKLYKSILEYILTNHVTYLFFDGKTVKSLENINLAKEQSNLFSDKAESDTWCIKFEDKLKNLYGKKS